MVSGLLVVTIPLLDGVMVLRKVDERRQVGGNVEANLFNQSQISEKVLLRILRHPDVIQEIKFNENDKRSPHHYLYQRGKAVDYFILILQGRVEVEAGNENMKFETGPFSYYGVMALNATLAAPFLTPSGKVSRPRHLSLMRCSIFSRFPEFRSPSRISGLNRSSSLNCTDRSESQSISGSNTQLNSSPAAHYVPDFNVRALTDLQIVKITRSQYQNGLMASQLDNSPQSPDSGQMRAENNSTVSQSPSDNTLTLPMTDTPPDEHTSLLNEQNCLSTRQANHSTQSEI
ncbi:metal transporter CNNM4 isoform X3 [Tachysurus ichikawai]